MTASASDYRIARGESLRFVVQPIDDDGNLVDTTGWIWSAKLDTVGPNGLPARYTLIAEPLENAHGAVVAVDALLSRVLATLSTYTVSSTDGDGNVTAHAYGSIVLHGVPLTVPL